jgi:hypothetical protein
MSVSSGASSKVIHPEDKCRTQSIDILGYCYLVEIHHCGDQIVAQSKYPLIGICDVLLTWQGYHHTCRIKTRLQGVYGEETALR